MKNKKPIKKGTATRPVAAAPSPGKKWSIKLPMLLLFFLITWAWAAIYYGYVFHICREYSFWVADTRQMQFALSCSFGWLRDAGRMLLMLFQYQWAGGLLLALLLTGGSWLTGYCLRLSARWRFIQYLPAIVYMGVITFKGLNIFFEAEAGFIMGVPLAVTGVLAVIAILMRLIGKYPAQALIRAPKDETPRQNLLQLALIIIAMGCIIGFNEWKRPYVRVICQMMSLEYKQDWNQIEKVARAHAIQSNRPMACYYAIALLHTGQIAERMYDIRLDYDSLYLFGMDHMHNNANSLYLPEGNYHAGLVEPAMHACMEQMVMCGPSIRCLKLLVKCSLMRQEWELSQKYLRILSGVPFEGDFCKKYGAMVWHTDLVDADPEIALIRKTEPIHDTFENQYQQPTFMGYNLALVEGRSIEALNNSLCVCLYTKLMPQFLERLQPLVGTTPPEIIADGILLLCAKQPEGFENNFQSLNMRMPRLQAFMQDIRPYMGDRAAHAYELFPKYKGYYPYYYFFGNLKATKKGYTGMPTSNSGVN